MIRLCGGSAFDRWEGFVGIGELGYRRSFGVAFFSALVVYRNWGKARNGDRTTTNGLLDNFSVSQG